MRSDAALPEYAVASSARELSAVHGRGEDTAVVDAIQRVQLFYSSRCVLYRCSIPSTDSPGPGDGAPDRRSIAYDNELLAIEGTGKILKDALENSARFFSETGMPGFNYDMAEGVEYEIDRSRPEGDRIRNLRYQGKPLAPEQKLRIAINNYRAGGSGGYTMFQGAKAVWHSGEEIRDLLIRYYTERKSIRRATGIEAGEVTPVSRPVRRFATMKPSPPNKQPICPRSPTTISNQLKWHDVGGTPISTSRREFDQAEILRPGDAALP
jgi:hypothetical protein